MSDREYLDINDSDFNRLTKNFVEKTKKNEDREKSKEKKEQEAKFVQYVLENEKKIEETLNINQKTEIMKEQLRERYT